MILSDRDIKKAMDSGELEITGHEPMYLGPSSVDLHLSPYAKKIRSSLDGMDVFDVKRDNSTMFEEFKFESLLVRPGQFYIMSTKEKLKFSNNIAGFIQGRSSIGRLGLNIHAAGFFDPGFEGTATLEISNFTNVPIRIYPDMRICQMVFVHTTSPVEVGYNAKRDQKYTNQEGPQLSKIHEDF